MKKSMRFAAALGVLILLAGALSGCALGEKKALRGEAESYVKKLQQNAAVSDTFTLSDEKVTFSEKTAAVPFHVYSETYKASFTVWIPRKGSGAQASDDYYSLYLKEEAEQKIGGLLAKTREDPPAAEVSFMSRQLPGLSGRAASTLEELLQTAQKLLPDAYVLNVRLKTSDTKQLTQEEIDHLMVALQQEGVYCRLVPYPSSAVSFEILKDGFWKTTQSGADAGAYLQREKYVPTVKCREVG